MPVDRLRKGAGFLVLFLVYFALSLPLFSRDIALSSITVETYPDRLVKGEQGFVAVRVKMKDGFHVNSESPSEDYLVPTKVVFEDHPALEVERYLYPDPIRKKVFFSEKPLELFPEEFRVIVEFRVTGAITYPLSLKGKLFYQACNDINCLAPSEAELKAVWTGDEMPRGVVPTWLQRVRSENAENRPAADRSAEAATLLERFQDFSGGRRGGFLFLVFLFLQGLALNLTPCVYPMIPVTVALFTREGEGDSRSRALAYFCGLVMVFTLMGVVAAFTGMMFGGILQNTWILLLLSGFMVYLALDSFGVIRSGLLNSISGLGATRRFGDGLFGTFMAGALVGFVAAPCIGPFILGLVILVAKLGNILQGMLYFSLTGIGLAVPYLLFGFFSEKIKKLPRAGDWMVWTKQLFGFIILALAVYFLEPVVPQIVSRILYLLVIGSAGVFLGFVTKSGNLLGSFKVYKRLFGALILITAVLLGMKWFRPVEPGTQAEFLPYSSKTLAEALERGEPVLVDFYADWCIPCREMDHITFSNKTVVEFLERNRYVLLRADLTGKPGSELQQLVDRYQVIGVPTILVFKKELYPKPAVRVTGFLKPHPFLEKIKK